MPPATRLKRRSEIAASDRSTNQEGSERSGSHCNDAGGAVNNDAPVQHVLGRSVCGRRNWRNRQPSMVPDGKKNGPPCSRFPIERKWPHSNKTAGRCGQTAAKRPAGWYVCTAFVIASCKRGGSRIKKVRRFLLATRLGWTGIAGNKARTGTRGATGSANRRGRLRVRTRPVGGDGMKSGRRVAGSLPDRNWTSRRYGHARLGFAQRAAKACACPLSKGL